MAIDRGRVRYSLRAEEGLLLKPYKCTAGKLTIGYGRNLEAKGISGQEAEAMLENDIEECIGLCEARFPWEWSRACDQAKEVLVEMVFQLGPTGVSKFKKFLSALGNQNYDTAANEMLDSKWARQTPNRANRLAERVRSCY